jgi:hypothetical protein
MSDPAPILPDPERPIEPGGVPQPVVPDLERPVPIEPPDPRPEPDPQPM